MAEQYTLKDLKVSDFKDKHNNTWCTAIFEEVGEPVKWVLKDPSTVTLGHTYWGRIEDKTSQEGNPYQRFYRETEPEDTVKPSHDASKSSWKPKDEKQITRNMVWKNLLGHYDVQSMDVDTEQWEHFWAMVDLHTEKLLPSELKNSGSLAEAHLPPTTIKEPTTAHPVQAATGPLATDLKEKLDRWKEPVHTDEDAPGDEDA